MKVYRKVFKYFLFISLVSGSFLVYSAEEDKNNEDKKTEQKSDLARIAILNFDDKTESENFQYMSGSLGDAVDTSMQKNFTYERVSSADIDKIMYTAKQKLTKEKISEKSNKKTDERLGLLKILAKELNVDIIIFGRYDFDQEAQIMNIHTNVYYVAIDEIADLEVVSNKVDSTIFGATDKAAANIISEIQKMAKQASEKSEAEKSKQAKNAEKPKKEQTQKIVLTRKMAKSYIRFVDNKNATITDNFTKLTWQKCTMGQKNDPSCRGVRKANNWNESVEYCKNLQLGDKSWRLPTAEELETIVDKRERPAVKVIFAPYSDLGVNFLGYWSSSLINSEDENSNVQTISFRDGSISEKIKSAKPITARCVSEQ
ncbi:MAG: DUF1566 domain-containing protein [Spirochaetia bacterium]|nr:DUF1566 domain-containing protein [Spirochaetia bacterium]